MRKQAQYYEPMEVVTDSAEDESTFFLTIYILMGYDMGQTRNRRIKMLLIISMVLHAMSLVATIASWKGGCLFFTNACFEAHDQPGNVKSFMYSFYRPTLAGDLSVMGDLQRPYGFIGELERSYGDTCVDGSRRPQLLKLEASFENKTHARYDDMFTLTAVPTVVSFYGMEQVNGYMYLAWMFSISFFFQAVSLYQANHDNDNYFETPCAWRWLEYALTSPMAIVLVASALMERDVNTLTLLSVAQAASVQFGFAVEYAIADFDERSTAKAIDFQEVTAQPVDKCPQTWPHQRNRLWWYSYLASGALHVTIWHLLIAHFINTSTDTDCLQSVEAREQTGAWRGAMIAVLAGQCICFSVFALVPLYQARAVGILRWKRHGLDGRYQTEEEQVRAVMRKGFEYYTILSVTAKVMLGVTYIAFVRLFPFHTVVS
jgi:hypothetical protein